MDFCPDNAFEFFVFIIWNFDKKDAKQKKLIIFVPEFVNKMIQRIQTLYILLAGLLLGLFWWLHPFYSSYLCDIYEYTVWITGIVLFINLFLFSIRPVQIKLGWISLILLILLIGLRIYDAVTSGGDFIPEKDVWWILPVVSIVFVKLAINAIRRDEDLVKSVDRIR